MNTIRTITKINKPRTKKKKTKNKMKMDFWIGNASVNIEIVYVNKVLLIKLNASVGSLFMEQHLNWLLNLKCLDWRTELWKKWQWLTCYDNGDLTLFFNYNQSIQSIPPFYFFTSKTPGTFTTKLNLSHLHNVRSAHSIWSNPFAMSFRISFDFKSHPKKGFVTKSKVMMVVYI